MELDDLALILVGLGADDGGRVNPDRILRRRPDSDSRHAFMVAQDKGWLDGEGWVTAAGRAALAAPGNERVCTCPPDGYGWTDCPVHPRSKRRSR